MTLLADPPSDSHKKKASIPRASHLEFVSLGELYPSPVAQRQLEPSWADKLAKDFRLEGMGFIVVNKRAGHYYIVDGQHRVGALRALDFSPTDTIQCEVYDGLTEEEECELFLERNHVRLVRSFDKFDKAVKAGREIETTISRLVRVQGLQITRSRSEGGISATTVLLRVYARGGDIGLGRMLRVIRDSYGITGFDGPIMEGLDLFLRRYNSQIDEDIMVHRLSHVIGGVQGLLGPAQKLKLILRQPLAQCIAAQAVDIYNRSLKGGKKIAPWWKS